MINARFRSIMGCLLYVIYPKTLLMALQRVAGEQRLCISISFCYIRSEYTQTAS